MHVDVYCERTAPGLWGEPFNTSSNIAFLGACVLLIWTVARQRPRPPVSIWVLPVLVGVVGMCSLAIHMRANLATEILDAASIVTLMVAAVAIVVHWVWEVSWLRVWLAVLPVMMAAVALYAVLASKGYFTLLLRYVAAEGGLVALSLVVMLAAPARMSRYGGRSLLAAGVLAVAISLFTLDVPLCPMFPIGTHFLWHVLCAWVLFQLGLVVLRQWQDVVREPERVRRESVAPVL